MFNYNSNRRNVGFNVGLDGRLDGEFNVGLDGEFNVGLDGGFNVGSDDGLAVRIKMLVSQDGNITFKIVSEQLKASKRRLERVVKALSDNKVLVRVGGKRYGHWEIHEAVLSDTKKHTE